MNNEIHYLSRTGLRENRILLLLYFLHSACSFSFSEYSNSVPSVFRTLKKTRKVSILLKKMKRNLFIILYFVKLCLSEESDGNLFPTLPIAPIYSSNELCKEDSTLYVESLNNLTLWAYKSKFVVITLLSYWLFINHYTKIN